MVKCLIFLVELTSYLSNLKSQEKLIVNSEAKILGNNHDIVSIAIKMKKNQKQSPICDFNLQVTLGKIG